MKNKILSILPNDKHTLYEVNHSEIHIVDWKNIDNTKGVEVFDKKQKDINSIFLVNNSGLKVVIDVFGENALPTGIGLQAEQCECIAFPATCSLEDWVLVIETKYANNEQSAFRIRKDDTNYPEKMVSQIVSTVDYLRQKNIIDGDKYVHAIISFPNLIADFSSILFTYVREEWSVENLIVNKKIRIKGCNSANIISSKRLKFITE